MTKLKQLKYMLCLVLALVCNVTWAQPAVGKYYKLKCKQDGSIVYDNVNNNNCLTAISGSDTSVDEDYKIWYLEASSTQGKYTLRNKKTSKYVTPGDTWKTADAKAEFYIYVRTAGSPNYYNLSTSTTADLANTEKLSLHCWLGTPTAKNWTGEGGGSQYEFLIAEVAVPEEKTYTINIEGGAQNQTIKIGDETYKDGDTYTIEGSVKKGDITVVAPEGQFAAVSINDAASTISVYFASIPEQTTSATYQVPVLYPAQQNVVGNAQAAESNNVYTLSNNVLAASFAKMGGALYFAGSKAMDLLPGTEPFTVAFGNGDNVPASAMTLTSVELKDLTPKVNAIGGAEHYNGKALEANYTYTYNESTITIVWRAVLRDGSHYLRTEMELTGVNDVDMFNIIPMIYNVDTKTAGSTPAVVGNTRGAILMSNKIFAGLETPTAYNTVGDATGEEDNYNLTTTMADVSLAANSWVQLSEEEAEAVKRVEETTGATYPNLLAYKQTGVELEAGQKVEVKVQYKTGNHRLNFGGADLIASNGDIAANDYHSGYSGGQSDKNTFTFTAPNDGTYTIRVIVENKSESIDATSTLTTKIYTPKEGVVINTDVVGIQGRWSRNTTLAQGETWKVGAVVGLIAQDGTEDDENIHNTQKRRSFLAYSERERAVPWRANPCYISWYELNINRNNAAPGSEHTNMVADQVLDVLAHWKSDMYDRYGVGANMYIIDDGWDEYGEWEFHSGFPNQMRDIAAAAKQLGGAGVGAWLGPVGGYGQSGTYRRNYWSDKGGMQLSNPRYYQAFKDAAYNLVKNQGDNYTFFKFDGISNDFSATGPDRDLAVDVANEDAEGIIRLERYVREELREDIFFNTTVGTWASPFWYQITDATWRQENDHGEIGNNSNSRENWITYRDRLVYQNYVQNSPICPINTLMTHGFILTKFGPPAGNPRDYNSVRNELRCAFLCGSGMVELYNDYDLMNSINGGALWADLAECIAWQKRNADVLPDAHWVGGNPWDGSNCSIYGWAAWNGTKSSLALRNGSNNEQSYTFTLRQVLNIPQTVTGSIILRSAFGEQETLAGLTEGKAYGIDESITVTLPGSSVYAFEGIASNATINNVSSITLTAEKEAAEVPVNETLVLKAAVNADATFPALAWTSSNTEVATVVGGLVLPKKDGTVTITATAKDGSGKTASVTLTVTPKVIDMDAPVVTDLSQLSNEKVYTLTSARAFLFYHPELTKICSSNGNSVGTVTFNNTDPNQLFRIEKSGENYYLYSVGAAKYVAKDGSFVDTATDALTFSDVSATNANYPWQLAIGGNGMNSQDKGQTAEGIKVNDWTTTDAGNCYKIEVGELIPSEFTQNWTANPVAPWSATALTTGNYPEDVVVSGFAVHKAEAAVTAAFKNDVKVQFVYSGGSHKLNILGVDLVNANDEVVASDYHHGTTGSSHSNNIYTLSNVAAGAYTLRYFVGHGNGDELNKTNGTITVTGLALAGEVVPSNLPQAGKYYRIAYDFGGSVGVKYMQSTASPVKGLAMTDDKGEGSIFLVEQIDDNLRLKSVSTGKYLKEDSNSRGLYDVGGNVTFTEGTDGKFKIQATSYLHANSSDSNYFIDHCGSDGCAAHNFIVEEVKVLQLTVNGASKVGASATWNGETKSLPATWAIYDGITITEPTLTVNCSPTYTFNGLTEGATDLGQSVEISSLTTNRTITAKFTPAFFSTTYGEKWVRLQNCSGTNYWATVETVAANGNGKTATLDYADEKQLWCLVGSAESFVLYNKAAGDKLALKVTAATSADGSQATLENDTQASWKLIEQDFGYALVPTHNSNTSNFGINMYGGNGGYLKLYGTGAGNKGSYWVVEMADVSKPLTLNVEVDKVWESSPRVAELTFTINGKASQTRILGSIEGQTLYLPAGATYEVSSMTYRGYTYNGCTNNDGVLTASYTANDERTLFYTPRDGHPYRIPAIATAPNGDIFAICDYRPCRGDIGNGDVDIVCRISSDNGVTWGEELVLANGDGGSTNRMETGYGDPAIVVDRESNKILVMMVAGRTVCGNSRWDASKIGVKDAAAVNRAARIYGTLNESTGEWDWTQPEEVTDDIYKLFLDDSNNATVTSYFIGSGKICQSRVVKKGEYYRLYCALWTRDQGNRVIYSDDFGGSWKVLGTINDRPASDGNEPKCEELPDGTVVLSSRVAGGRYFNLFTFADDTYTTGTWGQVANSTTVRDGSLQGTNGEIYKVKAIRKEDGKICDVMLQSIPVGPGGRYNVTVFYKEMDYTTAYTPATFAADWKVGKKVSDTESAYSTMHLQADGRIGFFFEEAPGGYCMVYIPYTLEDLTDNKYSLYTVNSTISGHGIGTFYASEAMQIPEGVKAYVVEADDLVMNGDDGYIAPTELEGIIPANTGAILMGDAETYNFIPSISYGTPVDGNMLVGYEAADNKAESKSAVTLPEGSTVYVLAVENEVAGFYKKAAGFNVYNNKAYLNVPGSAAARAIYFDFGGETGILETENGDVKTENCYDLSGRRVQNAQKGIYIVNGKKVVY